MRELPYANTSVGEKALTEAQKVLQEFGCQSFGHMMNFEKGELLVQFRHRDVPVVIKASFKGYANAWLRKNPYSSRMKKTRLMHDQEAMTKGRTAVYSIVRDWIKSQVTMVECGILSFEEAFLGQMLLPSGVSVLEHLENESVLQIEDKTK
jgi:hypothetical protein